MTPERERRVLEAMAFLHEFVAVARAKDFDLQVIGVEMMGIGLNLAPQTPEGIDAIMVELRQGYARSRKPLQ